jgi:hypothetical protein
VIGDSAISSDMSAVEIPSFDWFLSIFCLLVTREDVGSNLWWLIQRPWLNTLLSDRDTIVEIKPSPFFLISFY